MSTNEQQILEMKPGREMDMLVATLACGWVLEKKTAYAFDGSAHSRTAHGDDDWLPYYSQSVEGAWRVIEALERHPHRYLTDILRQSKDGTVDGLQWCVRIRAIEIERAVFVDAETFPLAMSRAALIIHQREMQEDY